jgi:hypothetical protein
MLQQAELHCADGHEIIGQLRRGSKHESEWSSRFSSKELSNFTIG